LKTTHILWTLMDYFEFSILEFLIGSRDI